MPLTIAVTVGCGGGPARYSAAATRRCLDHRLPGIVRVVEAQGALNRDALDVVFADGRIELVFERDAIEAQKLASASAGPGDPYGYRSEGNAVLGWSAGAEHHLPALARCLR